MLVMKMVDGDDSGGGDDGGGRRRDGCVGDDCHCDSSVGDLGDGLSIATCRLVSWCTYQLHIATCRWVIWCTYPKSLTSHPFIVSLNVSFICITYMLLLVILKRQKRLLNICSSIFYCSDFTAAVNIIIIYSKLCLLH